MNSCSNYSTGIRGTARAPPATVRGGMGVASGREQSEMERGLDSAL